MKLLNHALFFYILLPSCIRAAEVNSAVFSNKGNSAAFEENKGQIKYPDDKPAPEVKFLYRQGNLKVFLLKTGLAYQLEKYEKDTNLLTFPSESASAGSEGFFMDTTPKRLQTYRMDMELVGSNPNPEILAENKSQDYTNYYQPDLIQTHSYQKIIYKNIYPGIDWVIYLSPPSQSELAPRHSELDSVFVNGSISMLKQVHHDSGIKYDFIVHPGADPSQIKLKYKNAEQIYLDQFGNLILRNRLGDIREDAPLVFQNNETIPANYILQDSVVRFRINQYDLSQTLIIDPQLAWSTYYGGTGVDILVGLCIDSFENIYTSGSTNSTSNIAYNGFQNSYANLPFFIVKFDKTGSRIWASYMGSRSASATGNIQYSLTQRISVIDNLGNIYLVLSTNISDLAYNNSSYPSKGDVDLLLFKINSSNGNRIWTNYYGGSGSDLGLQITIDSEDKLILTGRTKSSNFPTTSNAIQSSYAGNDDGFIMKLDTNGSILWSSYLGGNKGDPLISSAVDGKNNIYIGLSTSSDSMVLNNSTFYFPPFISGNGFIIKLSKNGNFIWGKHNYGNKNSPISGISINEYNQLYVVGWTNSDSNIYMNGFYNQNTITPTSGLAYILRLDTNFNKIWGSYFPYSATEPIVTSKKDQVYCLFPRLNSSSSFYNYKSFKNYVAGSDVGIVKIDTNCNVVWSSYYGGNNTENGYSIDIHPKNNNLYMCGSTNSTSGIAYNGFQNTHGGSLDGFLAKIICNKDTLLYDTICSGDSVFFKNSYKKKTDIYKDTLKTWDICDSFITLHLTVLRKDTTYLYDTICSGTSYVWNGQNRTASGVYRDTLINNVGCDSFLILNLHIKRTDTTQVYDTLCNNLPKIFNGQNLTLAGVYRDTLINNVGCDSHIFYHFIPKPVYETPLSRAICAGDSSLFGGRFYKQGGVYYDTLKTIRNCDSVLKLTLTINPLDTNKQTQSICRGKSYNFYSQVLTSQGTYSHKFTNRNGCDSLILMTISVIDSSTYSFSRMLCSGQSFSFNNQNLTQAGAYRDTFTNYLGCDSFVTLNLSFGLVLYDTLRQTVCAGQVFRGYSSPGTYTETYKSSLGCDSILTIYLRHLPATEYKTVSHSKCGAFVYGARTYAQNDSFKETIKNYLNCDSIVTKHLVFITEPQPKFLADKTIEFCEEIMHKGQLKTTSFYTQDTVKSAEFPYCDSLYQPYYYRRESRPILSPLNKQIDTVIKGETTSIQVSGALNYLWTTGEQSSGIRPQINEDKIFEVTAWNLADCEEKMRFNIYAIDQPLIDFPSAFSPNGDGLNDYFTPNINGNITIEYLQVFNRWGEKVYEYSPNTLGWDGSYLGNPAANGLYTYTLRYSYLGRVFTKSGEMMVVR